MAFDLPAAALGFADEAAENLPDDGIGSLVQRNVRKLAISDSLLAYFRQQHAQHTLLDNIAGPGLVVGIASMNRPGFARGSGSGHLAPVGDGVNIHYFPLDRREVID
jgi:hypothetical protein